MVEPSTLQVAALAAQGPSSPGFRVRMLLPSQRLAQDGIKILPKPFFTLQEANEFRTGTAIRRTLIVLSARRRLKATIAALGSSIEVAFVQRQIDMLPSLHFEKVATDRRRLVYDVDDAIWFDTHGAGGHRLAFIKGTRAKVRWLASRADHVIAGNELLADHLAQYTDQLSVIPSLVDVRTSPLREHRDKARLVVGWIGSHSTAPYVEGVSQTLSRLARLMTGNKIKLLMVGGEIRPPESVEYEAVAWSPKRERRALEEMDVGIMPAPNTPWTRGKCAYKALQYMAAGIPTVADNVGVTADVVGDGMAGYVVQNPSEWLDALLKLCRDPTLRTDLGAWGRARVEADYSVDAWAPRIAAILRG